MNLSVSILQTQRLTQRLHTPADLLRLAVWSFALPNLMFLVPQTGFQWIAWNYPAGVSVPMTDILGGTMAVLISSLLPVLIYLEARRAGKRSGLNKKGLALFALVGVAGACLLGFGLPGLYVSFLHPNGYIAALPYVMALGGFVVWMALVLLRKRVVR